jgi:hypothetical protein
VGTIPYHLEVIIMLLYTKGEIAPASTKSHIVYRFHLNEQVRALCVKFAYTPKRLEDREQSKALILEAIDKYTAAVQNMKKIALHLDRRASTG